MIDRTFDDFEVGDFVSFERSFSVDDFKAFSALSGDENPLHWDADYAAKTGIGITVVPLHLTAAPFSAVAGMMLPGRRSLYLSSSLRALQPVPYDTSISYSVKVIGKHAASQTLRLRGIAFFSDGAVLLETDMLVQVLGDAVGEEASAEQAAPPIEKAHERGVALITGASGAIGRAVARAMAQAGWDLLLHYNSNAKIMDGLVQELKRVGRQVNVMRARLDTEAGIAAAVKAAVSGTLPTTLVHIASPDLDAPLKPLITVNYEAARRLLKGLLPEMLRRQDGQFLLLGSSAVHHNPRGLADYTAAKNAAVGLAAFIEGHYSAYGVRGKVVAPGYVDTEYSRSVRSPNETTLLPEEVAEAVVNHLTDNASGAPPYLWVEPGFRRKGSFGFHEATSASVQRDPATQDAGGPGPLGSSRPAAGTPGSSGLDQLVRTFLELPPAYPLSEGGLDVTPGWDSLRHIELMIFVESELGVAFNTAEIAGATRYSDLAHLVEQKLLASSASGADR